MNKPILHTIQKWLCRNDDKNIFTMFIQGRGPEVIKLNPYPPSLPFEHPTHDSHKL